MLIPVVIPGSLVVPEFVMQEAVCLPGGQDGSYECVLEEPGCPMTRYFLCAQREANSTGADIMRQGWLKRSILATETRSQH